jgi:hypothetical protein
MWLHGSKYFYILTCLILTKTHEAVITIELLLEDEQTAQGGKAT